MSYKELYIPRKEVITPHNKLVTVTGVSGSGKDYLLDRTKIQDPRLGDSVQVLQFGEHLYRELAKKYNLVSRDEIKTHLNHDQIALSLDEIVRSIKKYEPGIINSHVFYKQQESLVLNPKTEEKINPQGYVFIWSDPDQVYSWRQEEQDKRKRPEETVEEIAFHQELAQQVVGLLAAKLGSSMRNVYNYTESTQASIDAIREEINSLIK